MDLGIAGKSALVCAASRGLGRGCAHQNIRFRAAARHVSEEEELSALIARSPAGRFRTTEEFGAACAFVCSAAAGYITGQNLLIDGGAYPGTL
jgi:NAD(P)-dependent dehydrogenase (short-subunit alcohol dehydrogenase family)